VGKPFYADLGDLDEDRRIEIIGRAVVEQRKVVGVIVDAEAGKAERYIHKLTQRFPSITTWRVFGGPVEGTVSIKFFPPGDRPSPVESSGKP
jgi:hypothetical protein